MGKAQDMSGKHNSNGGGPDGSGGNGDSGMGGGSSGGNTNNTRNSRLGQGGSDSQGLPMAAPSNSRQNDRDENDAEMSSTI